MTTAPRSVSPDPEPGDLLLRYTDAQGRHAARTSEPSRVRSTEDARAIRAWAARCGVPGADSDVLAPEVLLAFRRAHGTARRDEVPSAPEG